MKREKPENINILYFKAPVNNLIHAILKHVQRLRIDADIASICTKCIMP
jgi:hypothetical protein